MTPIDYRNRLLHQPRRQDRAIEDEDWIRSFLHRGAVGHLATAYAGQPFVHTNLFAFDEPAHALYLHTAAEGRTRFNVEQNPRACFTTVQMGRLLSARTAGEFSVEYASVVVFGRASIVQDEPMAVHGLQLLLDKYFGHLHPGADYRRITPEELGRTTVLRIDIESWSGKRKQAPDDLPGAFMYPHGETRAG